MSLFRRTPPEVRAVVPSGERLASWASTADGPVVATDRALHLPGCPPVAWWAVEKAVWSAPTLTVTVLSEGETVVAGAGPSYTVVLTETRDLPEVVRARVSASVAWSSHHTLVPAGGVRVVGRRLPEREVFDWQRVFDADTDLSDPYVRRQADQLLEAARRGIG